MLIIMRVYRSGYRRILKVPAVAAVVTVILMAVVVTVALAAMAEAAVISKRLENF